MRCRVVTSEGGGVDVDVGSDDCGVRNVGVGGGRGVRASWPFKDSNAVRLTSDAEIGGGGERRGRRRVMMLGSCVSVGNGWW